MSHNQTIKLVLLFILHNIYVCSFLCWYNSLFSWKENTTIYYLVSLFFHKVRPLLPPQLMSFCLISSLNSYLWYINRLGSSILSLNLVSHVFYGTCHSTLQLFHIIIIWSISWISFLFFINQHMVTIPCIHYYSFPLITSILQVFITIFQIFNFLGLPYRWWVILILFPSRYSYMDRFVFRSATHDINLR